MQLKKMLRNACVFLTCFENKVDIEIVENVSCVFFFLHKRTLIGIIFSEELAGIFFARLEMHLSSERGGGRAFPKSNDISSMGIPGS